MEVRDFVVTVKNIKYLAIEKQSGITLVSLKLLAIAI